MLRDGRTRLRLTQAEAARRAGISRGRWADFEAGRDTGATLTALGRAAGALGAVLEAYISETSAADQPRDAVHLRNQELIIRLGRQGAWRALPEELIDREARTSRAADVLLYRASPRDGVDEYALWDVRDWVEDVGGAVRDFLRRTEAVERLAVARMRGDALPRTGACFVLRATTRNRRLVADHRNFFRARFPGSAHVWLASLQNPTTPVPTEPALVWVSVKGDRLYPAHLRDEPR